MLIRLPIEILVILLPVLLFSLCFHEFSHALIAYLCGDKTAYYKGRLTLNPISHLDPIGTLMILFVGFGWAKPVPVNPINLKNRKFDMIKVAIAGPLSNLFLASISGIFIRLYFAGILDLEADILKIMTWFTYINIMLAVFNLLPIAPLDGSQIFGALISKTNPELAWKLQVNGPKVLLMLIIIGLITKVSIIYIILSPFIKFFLYIFVGSTLGL